MLRCHDHGCYTSIPWIFGQGSKTYQPSCSHCWVWRPQELAWYAVDVLGQEWCGLFDPDFLLLWYAFSIRFDFFLMCFWVKLRLDLRAHNFLPQPGFLDRCLVGQICLDVFVMLFWCHPSIKNTVIPCFRKLDVITTFFASQKSNCHCRATFATVASRGAKSPWKTVTCGLTKELWLTTCLTLGSCQYLNELRCHSELWIWPFDQYEVFTNQRTSI